MPDQLLRRRTVKNLSSATVRTSTLLRHKHMREVVELQARGQQHLDGVWTQCAFATMMASWLTT